MNNPSSHYSSLVFLGLAVVLLASVRVQAQDCSDPSQNDVMNPGGGDMSGNGFDGGSGGDNLGSTDGNSGGGGDQGSIDTGQQIDTLNSGGNVDGGVTLQDGVSNDGSGGGSSGPEPINVTIKAADTVYANSQTSVSSTAWTTSTPISLHTIEYINTDGSDGGLWHLDIAAGAGVSDPRSAGVTYPSPGTYLVRSGASTDGGNSWTYSDQVTVTVKDPITPHTVSIQAKPKSGMEKWFLPSDKVSKDFKVLHTNPYP
jgi:hypothetical protein